MVIEILLYSLIMLSAVPIGLFLAWLCDDEMVYGKKWFKIISVILVFSIFCSFLLSFPLSVLLALIYFLVVVLMGFYKSK